MVLIWLVLSWMACRDRPAPTNPAMDLLHLEAKIPLPNVTGRIDHLAFDPSGRRLFVAALGNNTVEVVDLQAGRQVFSIGGLHEPQGVVWVPEKGRLVVANGGDGVCAFYDGRLYSELGKIDLGKDADNLRYERQRLYAGYGDGGIAIIDAGAMRKLADLPLKGHPESFQLGDSNQIFINVPDEGEIVKADLGALKVHARWKNKGASANFPMSFDRQGARLYVAYRHPAELRIVDARSGLVVASSPCVGDADDVFFDAASGLAFVSGGEGFLDVFRGTTLINHIETRRGARTCLWVPEERKLLLAVPARGGDAAAIWVFKM